MVIAERLQLFVTSCGVTALVIHAPIEKQLSGFVVGHGDLLVACVKITTYNNLAAAGSSPFSEPWSSNSCQVYLGIGADPVIQSDSPSPLSPGPPAIFRPGNPPEGRIPQDPVSHQSMRIFSSARPRNEADRSVTLSSGAL